MCYAPIGKTQLNDKQGVFNKVYDYNQKTEIPIRKPILTKDS